MFSKTVLDFKHKLTDLSTLSLAMSQNDVRTRCSFTMRVLRHPVSMATWTIKCIPGCLDHI